MAAFSVSTALLDAVVLACVAQGDTYGYELTHQIQSVFSISESTLYPVLRRLQKNEYLQTYDQPYQGRNRRYYHITDAGRTALEAYCSEWQQYKQQVDQFLTDSPEEAADRLLHDGKPTVPGKKKTTFGWKLTVIILTFPFWIGILAAWFALLVTAWVVLAVFPIALAAGSIGSLIGGIGYFSIYYPIGLQGIGWALAGGGLTMLCWKPCLLVLGTLKNTAKP